MQDPQAREEPEPRRLVLALAGDVMTGRGVDQVLPHPGDPRLWESYAKSALDYVALAEAESGPVPRPLAYEELWGEGLELLESSGAAARVANLETSVTTHDEPWKGKAVHYRMQPENAPVLAAAELSCVSLANNHAMDFGVPGLVETLAALERVGIPQAGAGRTLEQARAPAVVPLPRSRRLLVFGVGSRTSGIPRAWAATGERPGVHLLEAYDDPAQALAQLVREHKQPGDVALLSIHWGPNWGFEVAPWQRALAHRCIDDGGVDLVHGHSSHHVQPIEVHAGRLILYGCGDLVTDYEGIPGHEEYRGDLGLLYMPALDARTGALLDLRMEPTRMHRLQLRRAPKEGAEQLERVLDREGAALGTRVERRPEGTLVLRWN